MGERTRYTPGTFSWTDLTTPDQEGAKEFYGVLFGWEATDNRVDGGVYYSMMKLDGHDVAAISPQPEGQRSAGAPPVWNSYVTVENADAALEEVRRLGGNVHAPAFDVLDVGRMGVAQDPQGAFFLVWEPRTHIGASLVNAVGALAWNELHTPDVDAAAEFYGALFDWTFEPFEAGEQDYLVIRNREGWSNGGITRASADSGPMHWLVYFGIEDVDSGLAQVSELGGRALLEPVPVGPNHIAVAQDPQGGVFGLYAGHFDD